ncbi:MAG: molybdopterin synthase sulfur carrier subunit [Spirochaetales bacterium]|jgi:sulfur-carrier protein|nr:molybdopterin synthase sulfur carrier subunit [Spirochaetales bacterium]
MTVIIPEQFKETKSGEASVEIRGAVIGEVLQKLCEEYPSLHDKLFTRTGTLKKTVNLYLNKEDLRYLRGMDEPVTMADELIILPPASGG